MNEVRIFSYCPYNFSSINIDELYTMLQAPSPFGNTLCYIASFPDLVNALQHLQGHIPDYPVVLEILHQLCHLFKAGKLFVPVGYLATWSSENEATRVVAKEASVFRN
jgi:hypothetical protein